MVDDWERKLTQLGRTKSTHEYAMYQLLASMYGWAVWAKFLPQHLASASLLLTRAVKLLEIVTVRPAHSRPVHPTWTMALQQIMRCYHPQGKLFLLRAAFLAWDPLQVTHTSREVEISLLGGVLHRISLHAILCEFECFPGLTKVAAIMVPPELMTLATGDRPVTLIHCLEDRLCVWKPQSISEVSFEVVLIEGNPKWSGKARHSYGHLLFAHLDVGTYTIQQLQTSHPEVVPHSLRCEGLLRVLSWVRLWPSTRTEVTAKFPSSCSPPRMHGSSWVFRWRPWCVWLTFSHGECIAKCAHWHESHPRAQSEDEAENTPPPHWVSTGFFPSHSAFPMDMVLPQLDAYNSGRNMHHPRPWVSVCLAQSTSIHADGLMWH